MELPVWLLIVLAAGGGLFAFKVVYGVSVAVSLPKTRGALFVATTRKRIAVALDAVGPPRNSLLVDLGCGDGRVLRHARRYYSVRAVGYEVNPLAWLKAKLLCMVDGGIQVRFQDFRQADLSDAETVTCYLFPDVMKDISEAFRSGRFKTGARLVSFNFSLPGVTPSQVLRPDGDLHRDPIYVYVVP